MIKEWQKWSRSLHFTLLTPLVDTTVYTTIGLENRIPPNVTMQE